MICDYRMLLNFKCNHIASVRAFSLLITLFLKVTGLVTGTSTTTVFTQFQRQADYGEATCHSDDRVLYQATRDITQCLLLCANRMTCYTVLYAGHQCTGCGDFYDETSSNVFVQGTLHYQRIFVCDNGWYQWNRSCYSISSFGSFQDGQVACAEDGGHAVTVETESENEFLKRYLEGLDTGEGYFFLGITDECTGDGVWKQTETGDVMNFLDFWMGEPNGVGVECCIGVHESTSYRWVDVPCINFIGRTVCEKRPN